MDWFKPICDNSKLLISQFYITQIVRSLRLVGFSLILEKAVSNEEYSSRSIKHPQMKNMQGFTSITKQE